MELRRSRSQSSPAPAPTSPAGSRHRRLKPPTHRNHQRRVLALQFPIRRRWILDRLPCIDPPLDLVEFSFGAQGKQRFDLRVFAGWPTLNGEVGRLQIFRSNHHGDMVAEHCGSARPHSRWRKGPYLESRYDPDCRPATARRTGIRHDHATFHDQDGQQFGQTGHVACTGAAQNPPQVPTSAVLCDIGVRRRFIVTCIVTSGFSRNDKAASYLKIRLLYPWRPHGDSNPGSHRERVVS